MANRGIDERCNNCTAWWPVAADNRRGICQAHPPVPLFGAHVGQPGYGVPEVEFYFPQTLPDAWCREFEKVMPQP